MNWEDYIQDEIKDLYEIHDFKHAADLLRARTLSYLPTPLKRSRWLSRELEADVWLKVMPVSVEKGE